MKKISVILTAAAITTILGGTAALAAGSGQNATDRSVPASSGYSCSYCQDNGHCFTDADGDGICDYNCASTGQNAADAEQNTSGSSTPASGRHHMERNHGSGNGHHACARFAD